MGLGENVVSTWEDIQMAFLEKCQDYCKSWNVKEELFKFTQKEDESLEDCVERFNYTLQRWGHFDLDKEILKIILLQSLLEDSMELLKIFIKGDISKEKFKDIFKSCIQCWRGLVRNKEAVCSGKGSSGGVTKEEIENLQDNLRKNILSTLSTQMDTLQVK